MISLISLLSFFWFFVWFGIFWDELLFLLEIGCDVGVMFGVGEGVFLLEVLKNFLIKMIWWMFK